MSSRAPRVAVLLALGLVLGGVISSAAPPPSLLVTPTWLETHRRDPNVRIVDMATRLDEYRKGHIPGAVYVDVTGVRVGPASGPFRPPAADDGARIVQALGIDRETIVVIYDDAGGLNAARLFFALDVFGHSGVALLDGGIQAWRRAGYPLSREIPVIPPTGYRPAPNAERLVSADRVAARLGAPTTALVDARSPPEYAGTDVRARRGGHIPGAVNIEWKENLRPDGTFKPLDELRAMYAAKAVTPDKSVVTYCQTHHRGSHVYFVLRLLGYRDVAGYERSWSEWGDRADLPVER